MSCALYRYHAIGVRFEAGVVFRLRFRLGIQLLHTGILATYSILPVKTQVRKRQYPRAYARVLARNLLITVTFSPSLAQNACTLTLDATRT